MTTTTPEGLAHVPADRLSRMLAEVRTHPACARAADYSGGDDTFAVWLRLLERRVIAAFGVSCFDLADYNYRDAYDAGMTPREAALEALAEDDLYGPLLASLRGAR